MKTGSVAKVETSNFARADLEHELLMLDDDMKLEALPQTNNIKAIITAELPMDLERKRQQSYQGDLYVRFIGLGNGVLQALHDRSVGFFRRQIILTAKEKGPNRKDDPYIAEKMAAEAEGIFLWALEFRTETTSLIFWLPRAISASGQIMKQALKICTLFISSGVMITP